jgi:hypothetical protein
MRPRIYVFGFRAGLQEDGGRPHRGKMDTLQDKRTSVHIVLLPSACATNDADVQRSVLSVLSGAHRPLNKLEIRQMLPSAMQGLSAQHVNRALGELQRRGLVCQVLPKQAASGPQPSKPRWRVVNS